MHQKEPVQRTVALASACAGAPDWCVAVLWEKITLGWYQLIKPLCLLVRSLSHTQEILLSHFPAQSAN